jgi:hypothetical protein
LACLLAPLLLASLFLMLSSLFSPLLLFSHLSCLFIFRRVC